MFKKALSIGLAAVCLCVVGVSTVHADEWNKKTTLTFSQPVEIPGHVLPAGTYVFKLADSLSDRHIVQVFNADETEIIATFLAIPDARLTATDQTVIKFTEVPRGSPEVIRAWFYPGNTIGQEFVYPKQRATELAMASKAVVPAVATDATDVETYKTVPIITVTPDQTDVLASTTFKNDPAMGGSGAVTQPEARQAHRQATGLPKTASELPLIALLAFASIVAAFGLMVFGKRANTSVR